MVIKYLILLLMCTFIFSAGDYKNQLNKKQKELRTVYKKLQYRKSKVNQTDQKAKEVLKEIHSTEKILNLQNKKLTNINKYINKISLEIVNIKKDINQEQHRFNQLLRTLQNKYKTYYKINDINFIELLLDTEQITNYFNKIYFFEVVVNNDLNFLKEIKTKNEQLQAKDNFFFKKLSDLNEKKIVTNKLKKEIETNKKSKQWLYKKLKAQKKNYLREIKELEKNSKEIELMVIKLQKKYKNFARIGDGTYIWPLIGRISSYYGWRTHPIFKTKNFHSGLDIAAPKGRPVFAADSGIIIYSGIWGKYGKTIIIDHGDKITTLYAHLSSYYVKRSIKVKKGQVIGLVGSTGWTTGPHLHFEIRSNGKHTNPILHLPKKTK